MMEKVNLFPAVVTACAGCGRTVHSDDFKGLYRDTDGRHYCANCAAQEKKEAA